MNNNPVEYFDSETKMFYSQSVVSIASTLKESGLTQKEIDKRISELGLSSLAREDLYSLTGNQVKEILEKNVWLLASKLKNRKFIRREKNLIQALNFLEVFCLYGCQSNTESQRNRKYCLEHKLEYGKAVEEREDKHDSLVIKAVNEIEKVHTLIEAKLKNKKITLHIENLHNLIQKIYTGHLSMTEQLALQKPIQKAYKILRT